MSAWSDDQERRWSREHIGFPHARGTCRQCDEDRARFKVLDDARPGAIMGHALGPKPMTTLVLRLLVTVLVLIVTVSFLLIAWSIVIGAEV